MDLAAQIARRLEAGKDEASGGAAAKIASRAWSLVASRRVARSLRIEAGARVIAVGGATLGGSGKTPLAIACAAALASGRVRVALVGHAYRAMGPREAHLVRGNEAVEDVGDEALVAARALAEFACARVVVAGDRQAALDRAVADGCVAVLDGVAQTSPRPASLALLALDSEAPWGSGACPPRGDLRASREALLHASDRVVMIADGNENAVAAPFAPISFARVESRGAFVNGALVPWSALAALRVGLLTSLARPVRVARFLARRGVRPSVVFSAADHAPHARSHARAMARARVDLWLTTAKCAVHAPRIETSRALAVIDYAVVPDAPLVGALLSALAG